MSEANQLHLRRAIYYAKTESKKSRKAYIQRHLFLLALQFAVTPLYHASLRSPQETFQTQESFVESL